MNDAVAYTDLAFETTTPTEKKATQADINSFLGG